MPIEAEVENVTVRTLYSEGCASTPPAVALVKKIAQDLNIPVTIEMVMVGTQRQAQELLPRKSHSSSQWVGY
jgi:hypothetical protein